MLVSLSNLEQKQWNRGSNSINFPKWTCGLTPIWRPAQPLLYYIFIARSSSSRECSNKSKAKRAFQRHALAQFSHFCCSWVRVRGTKEHKLGRYLRGPMVIKGQWCRCGATNSHIHRPPTRSLRLNFNLAFCFSTSGCEPTTRILREVCACGSCSSLPGFCAACGLATAT